MHILRMLLVTLLLAGSAAAQQLVSFPTQDGGIVYADLYGGKSERGVVLAHGGRFTKESWAKQAQVLEKAGFRVLAIDFRGRGQSRGPQSKSDDDGAEYDVLAAVRYLRKNGAKTVSPIPACILKNNAPLYVKRLQRRTDRPTPAARFPCFISP